MMNCKILMLIPIWRRPEILRLFLNILERNICDYAEVIPFFILSKEDPELSENEKIIRDYMRVFFKNEPLGEKMNYGILQALQLNWRYLMNIGSDDLITPFFWELLEDCILTGEFYFGFRNYHAYNYYTGEAKLMTDYHLNLNDEVAPIGPGRCIRRDLVERLIPLYPAIDSGLDGHSDKKIQNAGFSPVLIDNGNILTVCDVKTNCHITPWNYFEDMGEVVDAAMVREQFGITRGDMMPFEEFHNRVVKGSVQISRQESFERVNLEHFETFGCYRFSSVNSYKVAVNRKYKKQ